MPTSLSFVSASFDTSCQSFVITVSTIGVGGGITVSATAVLPNADVSFKTATVTVPLTLEVIQDETVTVPDAGEIATSGRSAKGLSVSSADQAISPPVAGTETASVNITVALDLQPIYVRNTLSAITPPLRLFSLLTAWLGLLSIGGIFLQLHMAAANKIAGAPTAADLVAQAQATIIAEDMRSASMSNKSTRVVRAAKLSPTKVLALAPSLPSPRAPHSSSAAASMRRLIVDPVKVSNVRPATDTPVARRLRGSLPPASSNTNGAGNLLQSHHVMAINHSAGLAIGKPRVKVHQPALGSDNDDVADSGRSDTW